MSPAYVQRSLIEELGQKALDFWCKRQQMEPAEVKRVCTLYLIPNLAEPEPKRVRAGQKNELM